MVLLVVVDPEEVRVQDCLNNTRKDSYGVPVSVREIPEYPVRDVQRAIHAKGEEVVRRDCLSFTGSLQHKQLWQYSNGFKPDRKGPEHLYNIRIPDPNTLLERSNRPLTGYTCTEKAIQVKRLHRADIPP